MESKLYGLSAVEVVTPAGDALAKAHDAYIAIATSGSATPELRAYFREAGRALHEQQGAEIVVLGGTDLSVAFTGSDPGYPIADSALIHADAIARAAMAG
jgi:aspartate racemase